MVTPIFNQLLGSSQSKTAGTSLVISPASKTVVVDRTIFVGHACDGGGTAYSVTDNLGNIYSKVIEQIYPGGEATAQLWAAPVTIGGSLTTITISWTTNVTAKCAVAGEFSLFSSLKYTDGASQNGVTQVSCWFTSRAFFSNELWIGVSACEVDNFAVAEGQFDGTPPQVVHDVGGINTTGGGAAANMGCGLHYVITSANSIANFQLGITTIFSSQNSGVSANYNALPELTNPTYNSHPRKKIAMINSGGRSLP